MKISTAHQRFADRLGKPEALQNPENFLGPNYLAVINFWLYLDTLNQDQWKTVADRYNTAENAAGDAAWGAARNVAWDATANVARAAWRACWYVAIYPAGYAVGYAAGYATYELIGSHILLEQGKSLFFVPMFEGL